MQIKEVPADVHAELRRRAVRAGKSLQAYLLGLLTEEARTPSLEEFFRRVEDRQGGQFTGRDAVDAIHAERASR